jgi:hypothetical protein
MITLENLYEIRSQNLKEYFNNLERELAVVLNRDKLF